MSIVKEFNELNITLKSFLLSLVCIIPFWYFSIFLLKPDFINNNDIQIPIILSFCLSLCYLSINFLNSFLIIGISSFREIANMSGRFILSTALSIIPLVFLFFFSQFYKIKLILFFEISFGVSLVLLVFATLIALIKKE